MANEEFHRQRYSEIPFGGTEAARDAKYPNPPEGLQWRNTDLNVNQQYINGSWQDVGVMLGEVEAEEGFVRKRFAGGFVFHQSNLAATSDPTTANDSSQGYSVGSVWINITDDKAFHCLDDAAGAAVWKEVTQASLTAPPADADYLVGTADPDLTNEIVVGTSPGGELGGTWAAPTVDATHSGTPHSNVPAQTADLDMGGNNIDNLGVLFLNEQAAADADQAGKGQIWVRTATPNELYFTDDAGNDREIVYAGGAFHDGMSDFVANEHIDHTAVTLTAGVGLSGGGDISASRTFTVDLNELTTEVAIAAGDFLAMVDITDSGSGKITFANLEAAISHDNIADVSADDHHAQSHTAASHSDQGATGAELETLTDGSDADALHNHPADLTPAEHTAIGDGSPHHAEDHAARHAGAAADDIGGQNMTITGDWKVSGISGEIVPQTGAGTPSHSATEGTPYWDTTNNKLYVNNDGATAWTEIAAGGGGSHDVLSATHPDSLAGTVVRGDILVVNSTPAIARVAAPATPGALAHDGTDAAWVAAKRSAIFPIEGILPNATAGFSPPARQETTSNGVNYAVGTFAANEQGSRGMPLPPNYDGLTVTWWYDWVSPVGCSAGDTVIMQLKARAFADGDAMDAALGTGITITDTVLTGAGRFHKSAESSALTIAGSPAGDQWCIFEVERTGGTMSEEVEILAVYVRYGTNDYSDV